MEEALVSGQSPKSFSSWASWTPAFFCGRLYPYLPISLYPRLTSQPGGLPTSSFSCYELPGNKIGGLGSTGHIWHPWLMVLVFFLLIPLSRYSWIKLWYYISNKWSFQVLPSTLVGFYHMELSSMAGAGGTSFFAVFHCPVVLMWYDI